MDKSFLSRTHSIHPRAPRFQRRAAGALTGFLALQVVTACASRPQDRSAITEHGDAATTVREVPQYLTDWELRSASASGTLYDALARLRPDILLGRYSYAFAAGSEPVAVYVNGLRMRDADALRAIPTMHVRRVELVPPFSEIGSRAGRHPGGAILVTLRPLGRDALMARLRTLH